MSDQDLVARAAQGDAAACEELFHRYRAFVLMVARQLGAGDDTEDLMQDVFLQLLLGRWQLGVSVQENLQAFLSVVVWRHRRRVSRAVRRHAPSSEPLLPDDDLPDLSSVNQLGALISTEHQAILRRAVSALPLSDQHLLRLRYSGLTLMQIAVLDGRSPSMIHLELRRIHRQLATVFGVNYIARGQSVADKAPLTKRNWNRKRKRLRERRARHVEVCDAT